MAATGQLQLTDDEGLVARLAEGNRDAFAELYQRHFQELYDFAARIVRDREAAADIVQTAFARAWERAQLDASVGNPRAWLFRVTHNAAIDELRRRSKTEAAASEPDEGGFDFTALEDRGARDAASVLIEKEIVDLVWTTASALNPQDYALLDLHVRRELEPDELAEELGVTPGALYTRMSRLRRTFEDALTANLLIHRGRGDCEELDRLLGELEVPPESREGRRAVQAHVRECSMCQESKRRYVTAAEILAGFAPVPLTPGLEDEIWQRVCEATGLRGRNGKRPAHEGAARNGRQLLWRAATGRIVRAAGPRATGRLAPLLKLPAVLVVVAGLAIAGAVATALVLLLASGGARIHDPRFVWSPSHDVGARSTDRRVVISWSRQPEALGYSVSWNHQARQEPDAVRDLPGTALGTTSPVLTPGRWYFHLRTEGGGKAWTHTVHLGPYVIVEALFRPPGPPSRAPSSEPPTSGTTPSTASQPTGPDTTTPPTSPGPAVGGSGGGGSGAAASPAGGGGGGGSGSPAGTGTGSPPGGGNPAVHGSASEPTHDSSPPSGQTVELAGGPYFRTGAVRLLLHGGIDAGSGIDPNAGLVERSIGILARGSCRAWGTWTAITLGGGIDTHVGDGRCYRYRYRVRDRAGNLSPFSAPTGAAMVDTTPPRAPALSIDETGAATFASGTTLFYRPGGRGGSFTVTATSTDAGSGVDAIVFPGLNGGFAPSAERRRPGTHAEVGYTWPAGGTAAGVKIVTARDRAGNTARAAFVIVPDALAPDGVSAALGGGPWFTTGSVPLQVAAGSDAGSGIDPASLVVERDSSPLTNGNCGDFVGSWTPMSLQAGVDGSVEGGRCYRYRVSVSDNVGNVSTSAATDQARVDTSAPLTPSLELSESSSSLYATSTTLYYRPGAGPGAFRVSASTTDGESGIGSVTFPAIDGASGGDAETTAPHETNYDWSGNFDASGSYEVTATNAAGLSAGSDFVLSPDSDGPTNLAVSLAADRPPGAPVALDIDLGTDSGSGVDHGSLVVERDSAPMAKDGCGSFEGAWTRVTLVDHADPTATGTQCYRYRIKVADNVGNFSKSEPTEAVSIGPGDDGESGADSGSTTGEGGSAPPEGNECGSCAGSSRKGERDDDTDSSVETGHHHRSRVSVSDNVGNRATSSPSEDAVDSNSD